MSKLENGTGSSCASSKGSYSSTSLLRAIDILDAVCLGPKTVAEIAEALNLTRSTTYRLASALVDRRMLVHSPREGYRLGPRLIALGAQAREAISLAAIAQPVLDALSAETEDVTSVAVREGDDVVCIARAAGRRRLAVRFTGGSRVGVRETALGRALLWDVPNGEWTKAFGDEPREASCSEGVAFHFEDDAGTVCGVAAPIRDVSGEVIAAIGLSSAHQYMPEPRIAVVARLLLEGAAKIGRAMGGTAASHHNLTPCAK